ncbi:MAG: sigma-70 family RNA polymerase sigma factor [Planctomycetota bacterium]
MYVFPPESQSTMLEEQQQIRFTQLWTDAQPTVSQYVASLIPDQSAVRDIVQNTSLALVRKYSEYDESRPFLPWALGIAKFEVLGRKRDLARNRMICDTEFVEQYTRVWAEVAPSISEESTALQHCVTKLNGRSRTIIKLRYTEGKTSEKIANELDLSSANVRAILKRTRDALRRCIEKRIRLLGGTA